MDAAIFVADCHLDDREESLSAFLRLIASLPGRTERFCVLGDLFNLWVALPSFEAPYHRKIISALAELEDEGVAVFFVEGNREFFVEESGAARAFTRFSKGALAFEAAGKRVLLFHGDKVNRDDMQYLLWNNISKSRAALGLARAFPGKSGRRFAEWAERKMRFTNMNYRLRFPEEHALRYAREKSAEGHDTVVLGHFHQERQYDVNGKTLFVMPMWGETRRVLRLTSDGKLVFHEGDLA